MKKLSVLFLILALLLTYSAFAESIRIAALKGPTAMGMVKMMADDNSQRYEFTVCASADEITPQLVQGNFDIAAVPANLAAVLYAKTKGEIQVLNINTLGVMYIVEHGDTIHTAKDLKGRTIYTAGKGSTPEYALNYILTENGLVPGKDVTIEFKSEHSECLAELMNSENAVVMLPQPFLTTAMIKDADIHVALDLTEEWNAIVSNNGSAMITGVCVARKAFIDANSTLLDVFLSDYAVSVDFVNTNTAEAAKLIESYDIVPASIAEKALPKCNITFIAGSEMSEKLSGYLEVLFEQNPDSTGGALPDAQFYYIPSENESKM